MYQNEICICKLLMSAERKGCAMWFIHILGLFRVRYNRAWQVFCKICVTHFTEGRTFFVPCPHPWTSPKRPVLNRFKPYYKAHIHDMINICIVKHFPLITCSKLKTETLNMVWNMFKVNYQDTRMTPMTAFWYLYC